MRRRRGASPLQLGEVTSAWQRFVPVIRTLLDAGQVRRLPRRARLRAMLSSEDGGTSLTHKIGEAQILADRDPHQRCISSRCRCGMRKRSQCTHGRANRRENLRLLL